MDKPQYKLNCTLRGHTAAVRALALFEDGTLVSASRDKTARVWRPSRCGHEYTEGEVLKGHKNFVSSVCVLNPSTNYPDSWIITGSDKHIRIYLLGKLEPRNTIQAHNHEICNLRTGIQEGTYLSCSLDRSAKLWSLDNPEDPKLILREHTLSVWCIGDLKCGLIITGSADKLVIVWSRDGNVLHRLEGHTDHIRDLAAVKKDEFISCSNDKTLRHWNAMRGENLRIYYGHNNFIHGVSALANGTRVATCGEDQTVRVWENGENSQTVKIPASSVWCVKLLQNADIAAGSSDGVVRIYSCDRNRYVSSVRQRNPTSAAMALTILAKGRAAIILIHAYIETKSKLTEEQEQSILNLIQYCLNTYLEEESLISMCPNASQIIKKTSEIMKGLEEANITLRKTVEGWQISRLP